MFFLPLVAVFGFFFFFFFFFLVRCKKRDGEGKGRREGDQARFFLLGLNNNDHLEKNDKTIVHIVHIRGGGGGFR